MRGFFCCLMSLQVDSRLIMWCKVKSILDWKTCEALDEQKIHLWLCYWFRNWGSNPYHSYSIRYCNVFLLNYTNKFKILQIFYCKLRLNSLNKFEIRNKKFGQKNVQSFFYYNDNVYSFYMTISQSDIKFNFPIKTSQITYKWLFLIKLWSHE